MRQIWNRLAGAFERFVRTRRSPRLGLGVSRESIRGVLIARGRIAWQGEVQVNLQAGDPSSAIRDAVVRLLRDAPRRRRPMVIAAIGPAASQLRRLTGLPGATPARMREALVREGTSRLFVSSGVSLITSGVWVAEDGGWWAAAHERSIVAGVLDACRERRLRVQAILPSIAVIADGLREKEKPRAFEWRDGNVTAAVTCGRGGHLESVRRLAAKPGRVSPADAQTDNRVPDRWADAIGAALADPASALAIDPQRTSAGDPRATIRTRVYGAAAALAAAAVFTVVVPPALATWQAREAIAQLGALTERRRVAVNTERALAAVNGELEGLASEANRRRSMTLVLASLTAALPASTSLVSLRLNEEEGSLTAVASHGASVLVQLEKLPEIANPQIIGAVTREPATPGAAPTLVPEAEAQVAERVTVRFRWGPPNRRADRRNAPRSAANGR